MWQMNIMTWCIKCCLLHYIEHTVTRKYKMLPKLIALMYLLVSLSGSLPVLVQWMCNLHFHGIRHDSPADSYWSPRTDFHHPSIPPYKHSSPFPHYVNTRPKNNNKTLIYIQHEIQMDLNNTHIVLILTV